MNFAGNSPSACNTDHLAKVGKVHGRVLQGITSIEEVDNIVQEHLCQQGGLSLITSPGCYELELIGGTKLEDSVFFLYLSN